MRNAILAIRIFFMILCLAGGYLLHYASTTEDKSSWGVYVLIAGLLGALTILIDMLMKGISVRALSALTFGLTIGTIISLLIGSSPLFSQGDEATLFLMQMVLFIVCTYLGSVIALRGKDDFNLVIPYVRFVAKDAQNPAIVIDTSALIDGRLVAICEARFLAGPLIIPRFVVDELQKVADSKIADRQAKGRKGLQTLNDLRKLDHLNLTIKETDLDKKQSVDSRLVFLAKSMQAKLLTLDYNLAQLAEFQGVGWLNINALAKALTSELIPGEHFMVEIVKKGKENGQGVGFLGDGSMVVLNEANDLVGQTVEAEVISVLPSAGGKIIFGKILDNAA